MIDKKLLDILVCPACKQSVEYDEENQKLVCRCGLKYPIRDDIPIMMESEAERD